MLFRSRAKAEAMLRKQLMDAIGKEASASPPSSRAVRM